MELLDEIGGFMAGGTDCEAHFDRVCKRTRAFLRRYLSGWVSSPEDREDVISETFARIWGRRTSLEFTSQAAWWGYVTTTAKRVAYDRYAHAIPTSELDE